jgi:hypothetical protein
MVNNEYGRKPVFIIFFYMFLLLQKFCLYLLAAIYLLLFDPSMESFCKFKFTNRFFSCDFFKVIMRFSIY